MYDIAMHSGSNFLDIQNFTSNDKQIIIQAYIGLLLTELNSIPLEPSVGVALNLGKINIVKLKMQAINNNIFKQMKEPYSISSINIVSLKEVNDSVIMSLKINQDINLEITL